jgi:hypothetical protein
VKANDLILPDRGYPAFWLFTLILSKQADFCARVSSHWKEIKAFVQSGQKEAVISLPLSFPSLRQCNDPGLTVSSIQVRAIRIDLGKGLPEVLLTSLFDKGLYPVDVFKELYHLRWTIEESYKTAKCRVELENYSGKTVKSVYQDFFAKVFTLNLTTALTHAAQDVIDLAGHQKKHPYRINL